MSERDAGVGVAARWLTPRRAALVVAAIALPLYFVKLGAAPLVDPDEPYYAVPALEMLKSGTWAYTVFHGQPWFDKPILFYWAVLAAFKTFGVTEWSARVASALAGAGGAIAMAAWAPRSWRSRGMHLLAAIVLATSLEYAFLARAAVTDMMLTFFLTLGFLATARFVESGRVIAAALAGAAFGLATLTKGPVGVLVPAVALGAYALLARRRDLVRPAALAAAGAGFVAAAVPWYAYMIVAHRDLLVTTFLGDENLGRFLHPEHQQFPFFYLAVLAVGLLPWSAALPSGLLRAWRAFCLHEEETPGGSPGLVFAALWFLAVIGIFSLSASKLFSYVLPAFPPAALLIAAYWTEALGGPRPSPNAIRVAAFGGAVAVLAGAAAIVTTRRPKFADVRSEAMLLAAVLVVGAVATFLAARRGRLVALTGAHAGLAVAIVFATVAVAGPRLEEHESTKGLVRRLEARGLDGDVVGAFRVPDVSLDFYLGRTLARERDETKLKEAVAAAPRGLWVFKAEELDAIASRQGLSVEPVDTASRRWVVRLAPAGGVAALESTP